MSEILSSIAIGFCVALLYVDILQKLNSRKIRKDLDTLQEKTEVWMDENWEPETETVNEKSFFEVSERTQINCPSCGGKSYIKDGKCAVCHHGVL